MTPTTSTRVKRNRLLLVVALLVAVAVAVAVFFVVDPGGDGGEKDDPRAAAAAVTEKDAGGTVTVAVGKEFVVFLKGTEDAPWSRPAAGGESLGVIKSSEELDGSVLATFVALEPTPDVRVSSERAPACRSASPPCDAAPERFEVTIRVEG